MQSNFSRESPFVHRFLTLVRDQRAPISNHDLAPLLYPTHMPFSAPSRAGQILARLAREGWLDRSRVEGRDPGLKTYVLSDEGRKVLDDLADGF